MSTGIDVIVGDDAVLAVPEQSSRVVELNVGNNGRGIAGMDGKIELVPVNGLSDSWLVRLVETMCCAIDIWTWSQIAVKSRVYRWDTLVGLQTMHAVVDSIMLDIEVASLSAAQELLLRCRPDMMGDIQACGVLGDV